MITKLLSLFILTREEIVTLSGIIIMGLLLVIIGIIYGWLLSFSLISLLWSNHFATKYLKK